MDIYRRDLQTGSTMRVTDMPGDEFAPKWSPDGTEIVFYGGLSADQDGVRVVGADGGTSFTLANGPGWDNSPRWSPSGLEIAFRSSRTGRTEVWLVSRAVVGGAWSDPVQLTDFGCFPYDWAPDGSGVLCRADTDLVLVSPKGVVGWRYTPSTGGLQDFSWSRYSRDGSTIYAYGVHEDGTEGIWALSPRSGALRLAVAFDDAELFGTYMFSVGPEHLYVTVSEVASDIWVADLQIER